FGTGGAAIHYSRRLVLPWRILLPMAMAAFAMSYFGARTVANLPVGWLRPLILFLLVAVTAYTYLCKNFGKNETIGLPGKRDGVIALLVGGGIGFYDGFFGPGTGSFLIFALIRLFGFGFLHASAAAKIVNASTNFAALAYFWPHHQLVIALGFYMGALNLFGSLVGARLAVRLGTGFVRQVFLIVSSVLILKFAWEIFG
ncbi:MAG: sulfite exporter TauE/SafE family protein, partial [Taibaiella sp.]|nr:sulfite exporter TauE/SafE family protein [Taibaiella sp.]